VTDRVPGQALEQVPETGQALAPVQAPGWGTAMAGKSTLPNRDMDDTTVECHGDS
jgi:hypothetical protein